MWFCLFSAVKLARDQLKLMGVEENDFEGGEVEEVLQRYDQKKTYYIRSEFLIFIVVGIPSSQQ